MIGLFLQENCSAGEKSSPEYAGEELVETRGFFQRTRWLSRDSPVAGEARARTLRYRPGARGTSWTSFSSHRVSPSLGRSRRPHALSVEALLAPGRAATPAAGEDHLRGSSAI